MDEPIGETQKEESIQEELEEEKSSMDTSPLIDIESQTPNHSKSHLPLIWILISGVATIVLWQIPYGEYILYPFTILATWFHEMAHGIMAILAGYKFEMLVIFNDGSGYAIYTRYVGETLKTRILDSLVSAAGPLSGPICGSVFLIVRSFNFVLSRVQLGLLGVSMILSVIIYVRSIFGVFMISILGICFLIIVLFTPIWFQQFFVDFIGIQIIVGMFMDIDYLFTYDIVLDGTQMLSDTGNIQRNLLLPYWFWGCLIILLSFILVSISFFVYIRNNIFRIKKMI